LVNGLANFAPFMVQTARNARVRFLLHSSISGTNTPHSVPCQALFLSIYPQPTDSKPDRGSPKTPVFALIFAILKIGKDIAAKFAVAIQPWKHRAIFPAPTLFLSNFYREI